jgi:hypothetical protein
MTRTRSALPFLWCDHERDHHLHAVAKPIATVAEASQPRCLLGRIALKVGAREIVEQHFILRTEQTSPALCEMVERSTLVFEQLVAQGAHLFGAACGWLPRSSVRYLVQCVDRALGFAGLAG